MRAVLLILVGILASAQTKLPPPANIKVDFEKHVQPILAQKCHSCHGEEVQQSGLRLDRRQPAMRGGDYGAVLPDYATRFQAGPTTIGLLFASFGITLLTLSIPMGAVSDRVGRKRPLLVGVLVYAVASAA